MHACCTFQFLIDRPVEQESDKERLSEKNKVKRKKTARFHFAFASKKNYRQNNGFSNSNIVPTILIDECKK